MGYSLSLMTRLSYITSRCNQRCPSYIPHGSSGGHSVTLQLPLLTSRAHPLPKSAGTTSYSTKRHGVSPSNSAPSCFRKTSRLPQALHLSHLTTTATSRFPTMNSSGTPSCKRIPSSHNSDPSRFSLSYHVFLKHFHF